MFIPVSWLRHGSCSMKDVVIKILTNLSLHSTDSECVGGFPLFLSQTNSLSNVRELTLPLLNRGNCLANSLLLQELSSSGDFW